MIITDVIKMWRNSVILCTFAWENLYGWILLL
jgi:hypothetical protein